jgi:predicted GIY-YIG superfamily endonuclease
MKDAHERVIYVGKAKDLQQRLNHYRIANPDRMPRRHLKLVREVTRIEFQFCRNESSALKHEAKLIRSLRPKFNRAGIWPARPRFLCWREDGEYLELTVMETPEPGWRRFGPLGGSAAQVQRTLARLLWLAVNPERPLVQLPSGWMHGEFMERTAIRCGASIGEVRAAFDGFFWAEAEHFVGWLRKKCSPRVNGFERGVIEAELACLQAFAARQIPEAKGRQQLALL